jgi:hypothetical protein
LLLMISLVEELRMRRGLLSAKKAAERLSMNLQVLHRRAKAGEVPHLRIFGRVKFDPRILATWLEARQVSCTLRFDQALSGPKECEWSFPKAGTFVGIVLRGGENVTALGFLREHRRGTPACPEGHQ